MVMFKMNPKIGNLLYAGKAKDVYKTDNPERVIVKFRDDITAGDGVKTEKLVKKGGPGWSRTIDQAIMSRLR